MQRKNRMATLAATVQAEMEAKKEHVPRYERFAKADAALTSVAPVSLPGNGQIVAKVEDQVDNTGDSRVEASELSGSEISSRVVRETFSLPPQDSELIGELRD